MLRKYLLRFKPGVPRKAHLFLAALLWTFVGIGLMIRGTLWVAGGQNILFLPLAFVIGSLKSLFILDKSAKKSIDRIQNLTDGSCLGAVYSYKTWLLVLAMMGMGYIIRHSSIPLSTIGFIYVLIGWALLFSSRHGWKAWYATD